MRSARSLSPIPNWPIVNTNVCVAKLHRCSLRSSKTPRAAEQGGVGISGSVNSQGVHQGEIYGVMKGKIGERVIGQVVRGTVNHLWGCSASGHVLRRGFVAFDYLCTTS